MKSKTSFFNRATFKKNMTRFWPIWGTYLFCLVIAAPLTFLISKSLGSVQYYARDVEDSAIVLMPTVSMFMSCLSVMAVFSYLFKSNRIDFAHSLPIKRSSLFVTNYISGFCFTLIPNIIIALVMTLLMAVNFVSFFMIYKVLFAITLMTVFYYGLAVFCAMICGNAVAMPMVYLALNFLAIGINGIVGILGSMFLNGYEPALIPASRILSPIINMYMFDTYRLDAEYMSKMIVYAIAGVLLTVFAYLLYRVKKSESAGDIASFKSIRYIFRYILGGIGAYTVGMLLFYIFENIFRTERNSTGGCVIFLLTTLFGALLLYYVFEMFAQKKFKVFKGSAKGVSPLVIAVIILSLCTFFDLFGYSARVPDVKEVESVSINIDYNQRIESDDEEFIELVTRTHKLLTYNDNRNRWATFEVEYRLENGNLLKRRYRYYRDDEVISQSMKELLDAPCTAKAVAEMLSESEECYVDVYRNNNYISINQYTNGKTLVAAIINDINNGADLKFEMYDNYPLGKYEMYRIDIYLDGYRRSIHCLIDESFTQAWAYLQTVEKVAQGLENPEAVTDSEHSVGIIGGADGPTEIYVTSI